MKVVGRSNVPRWGQQSIVGSSISPKNKAREAHGPEQLPQQVNDPSLGSEDVTGQSPPITMQLSESRRDFKRDIREIDEALNDSP